MDRCVIYGAVIAALVSFAKRVPFVARRPKLTAGAASLASALVPYVPVLAAAVGGKLRLSAADVQLIAECAATQFGAAIVAHEVGIKQAATVLGIRTPSYARGFDAGHAVATRDAADAAA